MYYKRIIVKLGTNLITGGTDSLDMDTMTDLVNQIATLRKKKIEVILVSSGAITAGRQKLSMDGERRDIPFRQVDVWMRKGGGS